MSNLLVSMAVNDRNGQGNIVSSPAGRYPVTENLSTGRSLSFRHFMGRPVSLKIAYPLDGIWKAENNRADVTVTQWL